MAPTSPPTPTHAELHAAITAAGRPVTWQETVHAALATRSDTPEPDAVDQRLVGQRLADLMSDRRIARVTVDGEVQARYTLPPTANHDGEALSPTDSRTHLDWLAAAVTSPQNWEHVLRARALLADISAEVHHLGAYIALAEAERYWDWPDNVQRPSDPEAAAIISRLRDGVACLSNLVAFARCPVWSKAKDAQIAELYRLGLVPLPDPDALRAELSAEDQPDPTG